MENTPDTLQQNKRTMSQYEEQNTHNAQCAVVGHSNNDSITSKYAVSTTFGSEKESYNLLWNFDTVSENMREHNVA